MCYLNKVILSYSFFFFSSRRRHTRSKRDWSSDVCSSDLGLAVGIDYSLFIIHRHRRQLKEGYELTESIGLANGTSGSAVRSEERRVGKESKMWALSYTEQKNWINNLIEMIYN